MKYGTQFQRLKDIVEGKHSAEARIKLESAMEAESPYVIHPAALDCMFQLSMIASHAGQKPAFDKIYLPRKVGHLVLSHLRDKSSNNGAITVVKSKLDGFGNLRGDAKLLDDDGSPMVQARDVVLNSLPHQFPAATLRRDEFSRVAWFADIDFLSDDSAASLFPLAPLNDVALTPRLDNLAMCQLIQFREEHGEFFETGSDVPHLQSFLDWIDKRIRAIQNGEYPNTRPALDMSRAEREELIRSTTEGLLAISSEARLSTHIYHHLPSIMRKEKTGIQVALEDDRLTEMYKDAHRVREGNRRLANIIVLACLKNPKMDLLEIGAGTGSASNEVLRALKGDSIYRLYNRYSFTDITPSFLSGAEERFKCYSGLSISPLTWRHRV